jgi:hypothetical protein
MRKTLEKGKEKNAQNDKKKKKSKEKKRMSCGAGGNRFNPQGLPVRT